MFGSTKTTIVTSTGEEHTGEVVKRDDDDGVLGLVACAFAPAGLLCGGMDGPDVTIEDDEGELHTGKEAS